MGITPCIPFIPVEFIFLIRGNHEVVLSANPKSKIQNGLGPCNFCQLTPPKTNRILEVTPTNHTFNLTTFEVHS
jgi:hypothetical protein